MVKITLRHLFASDTIGQRERLLLLCAAAFVTLNQATLLAARGDPALLMWPVLVWMLCAALGHRALDRNLPMRDPFIFPLAMLLAGWGLNMVYRLAPAFAARQVLWVAVGVAALAFVVRYPRALRLLRRYPYSWLIMGLLLLIFTLLFGVNPVGYGPRLWLDTGIAYFQPSEALKVLLVVYLARYLADHGEQLRTQYVRAGRLHLPFLAVMGPLLTMWGFSCVVLVWQQDLGTAALFFLVFLAMLYGATGQRVYVLVGLGMLALAGVAAYFLFNVVQLRVDVWLNPWPESQGRAYQIVQSLQAVAAGGVMGQGIGMGAPTYIPVVHSDFVFAAIAEEWGLAGALAVVICFGVLAIRGLGVAARHTDKRPFNALMAAGLSITLAAQALLIMGGVLKLIPLTGVTLPFVSYGGSSLLGSFVLVGLLLLLSDTGRFARSHEI